MARPRTNTLVGISGQIESNGCFTSALQHYKTQWHEVAPISNAFKQQNYRNKSTSSDSLNIIPPYSFCFLTLHN
jgi:hypothetical protein